MQVETFNEWTSKLRQALSRTGADRVDLAGLKELLADAVDKRLPDTELVKDLQKAVDLADTCTQVPSPPPTRTDFYRLVLN